MGKNIKQQAQFKRNDKIQITVKDQTFSGYIEERFLGPWPETRVGLFVCVDDGFPHFPIPIQHFQPKNKEIYNYGTIKLA